MTNRLEVYRVIDAERDYQATRWNPDTTSAGGYHSPQERLSYIQDYANEGLHIGSREADDKCFTRQMHNLRKIAALAVAAMEQHGPVARDADCKSHTR